MRTKILGLMSGTSLDGLDVAYCEFSLENGRLYAALKIGETFDYPKEWQNLLAQARGLSSSELGDLSTRFAQYMGQLVQAFVQKHHITQVDYIASHGHTVHHRPGEGVTVQIGNGEVLAAVTGIPVVYDFRTQDVALGGQGAPLVPIGDRDLYNDYDACVNLGGFANISFTQHHKTHAFDICPVNVVLNPLAQKLGYAFDDQGKLAASGTLNSSILGQLNQLPYYAMAGPKSLGVEFVDAQIWPLMKGDTIENLLHTFTHHVEQQIGKVLRAHDLSKVLFSGGGALNAYLMRRLKSTHPQITLANPIHLHFKEAYVFAYLGFLRRHGISNILAQVTGASQDHCSGKIAVP